MGTNFYLRNKEEFSNSQEKNKEIELKINEIVQQIQAIIDEEECVRRIQNELEEYAQVGYEKIHIGKRSFGWKPSFEKQEYFSSVRELKQFYHHNKDTYDIVDESGRIYDWAGLEAELILSNPDGKEHDEDSYKDRDGYIWHEYPFS